MQKEFNPAAITSIKILNSCGYKAYLVGGAIRDYFFDCPCDDFDVVTNASIDTIVSIFSDYKTNIYSNRQCVGVKIDDVHIEISTFKGNRIEEDLANRDFSINSIAYNPETGFIDPYNSIMDIKNKRLRCIKDEYSVFLADPIRILRAIRFEIKYGLEVGMELYNAIIDNAYLLSDAHPMRIPNEINYIFLSDKPGFYITKYKEVFKILFNDLSKCDGFDQHSKWHSYNVFDHIMKVIDSTEKDLVLRLSAFFHDIEKPECFKPDLSGEGHFPNHYINSAIYAKKMLEYYSYNKTIVSRVYHLVLYHETRLQLSDERILSFLVDYGLSDIDLFIKLQKADIMGQNPDLLGRLETYKLLENRMYYLMNNYKIVNYKKLAIKEVDLVEAGYSIPKAKSKLIKIAVDVSMGLIENNRKLLFEKYLK